MKTPLSITLSSILLILGLSMGACAPQTPASPAETVTIRMALLPIVENLPMYVAQQEGLFAEHNINLEIIPAASAAERDQIFVAGQVDGLINEIISVQLYNKDQVQIQIVRFARVSTSTSAQFFIMVAGNSDIQSPQELSGVPIGISEGTIIAYVTDRLLEAEGLAPEEIQTLAVPKMPDRMALLSSGELKAATLPDPLSFLAEQQGARILLDDSQHPRYGHSTYAFRASFIEQNPQAVSGFLAAIEKATEIINADPSRWETLLSEQNLIPAALLGNYKIPPFPPASVPDQALWDDVLNWSQAKGLVDGEISYASSVTGEYLP
jgi:NitT/TauT family transport system substrate-binding protein